MRNSPITQEPPVLSATADYALRAILVLARAEPGALMSADDLADAIGAPRNYLGKTLNALAKARIVTSARGPLGGFALALPAGELSIARIADAFAEAPRTRMCLLGKRQCNPSHPCGAHGRWTAVERDTRHALNTTTVADLLAPLGASLS